MTIVNPTMTFGPTSATPVEGISNSLANPYLSLPWEKETISPLIGMVVNL